MPALSASGVWFLFSGYAVIVSFFIIQRILRKTESAKSFHGGAYDRGNMLIVGGATGLGLWIPLIADWIGAGVVQIDLTEGLAALAVMVAGVALRVWAAETLGRFYTTTLMVTEGHRVVSSGPYGRVRNPGYLGEIVLWSGFGVLSGNLFVAFLLPVMFVAVYLHRIGAEEAMLEKELGEDYARYRRGTRRLIPFIY